jgi:hypothetical protein
MKRSVLLLPATLLLGAAMAQPTLSFPDDAPSPGNSYPVKFGEYQSPGSPGPDQNWNFSNLVADSAGVINIVEPASAPGGAQFPNATAAILSPDGNNFVEANDIGLFLHGTELFGQSVPLSETAQVLAYPCTYQTGWEGTYSGLLDVFGLELQLNGTVLGFADGYGTLQLPEATLENVLRVRLEQESLIESPFGNFELSSTSYQYYKAGYDVPVLEIVETEGDLMGPIEFQTLRWMDVTAVGINVQEANTIGVDLFPNPAIDAVQVHINTLNGPVSTMELFDASGRLVRSFGVNMPSHGPFTSTMDLQGVTPGLYMLRVTDAQGSTGTARLQVM